MGRQARIEILSDLARLEDSGVLAYVTGDRAGMEIQIASDQLALFPRHIRALGSQRKISLLIYTRGGDTNMPWPLISFLRENCKHLQIIFPFYNHSSGTLLALGADEIVMGPFSSLSPIDPTVYNQFNPNVSDGTNNKIPIAVEDMLAYLELVEDKVRGRKGRNTAFEHLSKSIHPLALGNVRRNINLIRKLASKLIRLHENSISDESVQLIVTALTTEFYTHSHLIGRNEAREIGLKVVDANENQLRQMDAYYQEIKDELKLMQPWNISLEARKAIPNPLRFENVRGLIETSQSSDAFISTITIENRQIVTPQGTNSEIHANIENEGWVEID